MENSGFAVQPAGDKGKGLFATKLYKAGDTILEEVPLVCCQFPWNADYGYLACDHCLKPLETPQDNARRLALKPDLILPHSECTSVSKEKQVACSFCGIKYCSVECLQLSWNQYHRTLCLRTHERDGSHPLEQLKDVWKQIHYPPETGSIMLLTRMVALVQQSQDKENVLRSLMAFCHKSVNEEKDVAHKLLGEKFCGDISVLREAFKNAINTSHVENWVTPDGFISLLALIGTNGQGIGTSSFAEWTRKITELPLSDDEKQSIDHLIEKLYEDFDTAVGDFLNNDGSGLFPIQSACNHSCLPNAETSFPYNNYQLVLKAKTDIQIGEEICVSYLDECMLDRSRHSRQKVLRNNYLFECTCLKCIEQAGDPDNTSEEEEDSEMDSD